MKELDKINSVVSTPEPSGLKEIHQDTKESNPKDAIGCTKVPWSVLPAPVIGEVALAMLEGACKYGRHNYRQVGVRASIYYDAVMGRHMASWWEGEDIDPDSGLSHIVKAIAGLTVLRDAQMRGMMTDDRPPGTAGFVAIQNDIAAGIINRCPDPKPPITGQGTLPALYLR